VVAAVVLEITVVEEAAEASILDPRPLLIELIQSRLELAVKVLGHLL
jgi:hypothetical protein